MSTQAYLRQGSQPYPHIGEFVRRRMHKLNLASPEIARRLGVTSRTVRSYFEQPSLQFGIIWKLSMAMNYDLLSDLIAQYPPGFPVKKDEKMAEMEKELEILRGLLRR